MCIQKREKQDLLLCMQNSARSIEGYCQIICDKSSAEDFQCCVISSFGKVPKVNGNIGNLMSVTCLSIHRVNFSSYFYNWKQTILKRQNSDKPCGSCQWNMSSSADQLKPVINKSGQILTENVQELVLCKPRLIPLKSFTLEKLERMQQEAERAKDQLQNSNKTK